MGIGHSFTLSALFTQEATVSFAVKGVGRLFRSLQLD